MKVQTLARLKYCGGTLWELCLKECEENKQSLASLAQQYEILTKAYRILLLKLLLQAAELWGMLSFSCSCTCLILWFNIVTFIQTIFFYFLFIRVYWLASVYPLFLFLMIKIKYTEFIIWLTDLIYVVLLNPVKGGKIPDKCTRLKS